MSVADELRERLGRVGVWSGAGNVATRDDEAAFAAEVEALGYGALWFSETPIGKEAFVHAALLLEATQRLPIATGIANVYGRDPIAAMAAATTLAQAFPGRFVLGLGISHAPTVASRGHDYGRPLRTMRAYLDAMEAAQLRVPAPASPLPVVLAALRPKMLKLAGTRTAGAHPYFTPPEHTRRARATLGPDPWLAPEQMVLLERDPARAREIARGEMARYLQLPNYRNNLHDLGFGPEELDDGGSDRVVDAIVAWGDADAIADRVRAHLDAGADHVCIQPLPGRLPAQAAQLRELAGRLLG